MSIKKTKSFCDILRNKHHCTDDIVIYTGYTEEKIKRDIRTVFIFDKLVDYLQDYRKNAPENELVCPSINGQMYTLDSFRRAWESFQQELNLNSGLNPKRKSKYDPRFSELEIDNITPHMLRHTFCSMMYESGVSVKTAQGQMGHSSVSVTLGIYTHISDEYSKEDMKKMNFL